MNNYYMLTIYPHNDMGHLEMRTTWRDYNLNKIKETHDMKMWIYNSPFYKKVMSLVSQEISPCGIASYSTSSEDIYIKQTWNGIPLSVKINFKHCRKSDKIFKITNLEKAPNVYF